MSEMELTADILQQFLHTNLRVFLKNNFQYSGSLQRISKDFIILHDFKTDGEVLISISDISVFKRINDGVMY